MNSKIPKLDLREETEEGAETERANWDGMSPELLDMIFNHLLIADLLSCSVVSKTWKKASRDVLKRSRECYAYIKNFPQDVYDLIDTSASTDLMQMVNGLHVKFRPKDNNGNPVLTFSSSSFWQQETGCSNMNNLKHEDNSQVALSRQMRHLTLDMELKRKYKQGSWFTEAEGLSLEDAALLRKLISDTSDSLQKLVIWQDECCDFMSSCGKEFSKLKVAHVQYEGVLLDESFLKVFLPKFAPNLEEITGSKQLVALHNDESHFILKLSKKLQVFYFEMMEEEEDDEKVFIEGYRLVSELRWLNLQVRHCNTFDDDNILFSMLLKSLYTLEELRIYTPEFYNLFKTSDQLTFSHLRRLSLVTTSNMPVGDEIAILKQLNLPKLCPKLEQLGLSIPGNFEDGIYDNQEWTLAALPYRADQSEVPLQIEVDYRENHLCHEYFEFLNKIYPKISKVCMGKWEMGKSLYEMSSIFSDIPSLEYLEIEIYYWVPHVLNLQVDAFLCGISIEEVEFLFSSSPVTANAELNPCIVPTRPSLFNAKNLKELKITDARRGGRGNRSWVIQVTENLPVRHLRNLKVTFEGADGLYDRLNRLRAFTTLFCAQI